MIKWDTQKILRSAVRMAFRSIVVKEVIAAADRVDEVNKKLDACTAAFWAAEKRRDYAATTILRGETHYLRRQAQFRMAEYNQICHEQWWG